MTATYYTRRLAEPSNSTLTHFRRSPLAYYDHVTSGDDESTGTMRYGRAFHLALLEPERFAQTFLVLPDGDMRSKAGKEAWIADCCIAADVALSVDATADAKTLRSAVSAALERHGRTVLTQTDWDTLRRQVDSLNLPEHEDARRLIASCETEVEVRWEHGALRPKAKLDLLNRSIAIAGDVKTTDDADPEEFRRSVWSYGYHYQEAMYRRACASIGAPLDHFVFLLAGKRKPNHWSWVELDPDWVAEADERIERDLARLETCIETNVWPGRWTSEPMKLERRIRL